MTGTVIIRYFDKELTHPLGAPNAHVILQETLADYFRLLRDSVADEYLKALANDTRLFVDVWPKLAKALDISTRTRNTIFRASTWMGASIRKGGPVDFRTLTLAEFIQLLQDDQLIIREMGQGIRGELLRALTGYASQP